MAAAQPQDRRRPEQLVARSSAAFSSSSARIGASGSGPDDDDPDEVAERRVAERLAPLELAGEEALDVVARGELDRPRVRLEGLDRARGPARRARSGPRAA